MSNNTQNLKLYKADPKTDGNEYFDIEKMLNKNWDTIDQAVEEDRSRITKIEEDIHIPDYKIVGPTTKSIIDVGGNCVKGQVSPKIDGVTRTNLVPNFDSGKWNLHANVTVNSPTKVTLNATAIGQVSKLINIPVKPNQKYTISVKNSLTANARVRVYENGVSNFALYDGELYRTFTTGSTTQYIEIWLDNVATGTFVFEEILLEETDTVKPFIIGTKSTVCSFRNMSHGKNLANESGIKVTSTYEPVTWNGEKLIFDNRDNTGSRARGYMPVYLQNGKQYIVKKYNELIITGSAILMSIAVLREGVTEKQIYDNVAFNWDKPTGLYGLDMFSNYGSLQQIEVNVVFNEGNTAIDYEKYTESNQYIQKINPSTGEIETMNAIYDSNGQVVAKDEVIEEKLYKRTGKIILNSNQNWASASSINTNSFALQTTLQNVDFSKNIVNINGTQFIRKGIVNSDIPYTFDFLSSGYIWIRVPITTGILSDAITWLNNNSPVLIYQLAQPQIYQNGEEGFSITGSLENYGEGTTIIMEPYLRKSYFATETSIILDYPIEFIDKLQKLDDGVWKDVEGVLSSNGKMITGLEAGRYIVEGVIRSAYHAGQEIVLSVPMDVAGEVESIGKLSNQNADILKDYMLQTDAHLFNMEMRLLILEK
ncbi:hypothetical protein [Marinisporobacter balticus]|uniref:Uncharacterized protein n=1 Tax=Marinisporobacter balticus TaxID=2018667 RepID=A0A4R2KY41_9FIRM|nr:hypothetical protein [Marinisporobacter balticus]TCO78012.1 hypothetical protein EV214_105111 [Marinisporobacter balticus]